MKYIQNGSPTTVKQWFLLALVGIGLLMVALDITILYTALPTLARELRASSSQGLWIINVYPLVTAGLLLGAGTLGDRIGHRQMYLTGLLVFGISSLMAAFATTPRSVDRCTYLPSSGGLGDDASYACSHPHLVR